MSLGLAILNGVNCQASTVKEISRKESTHLQNKLEPSSWFIDECWVLSFVETA